MKHTILYVWVLAFTTILVLPVHAFAGVESTEDIPAAPFSVTTTKGEILEMSSLCGKYKGIVLNFWGIRCGACLEEIPHLNAISRKFADRVRFIGVNIDGIDAQTLTGLMAKGGVVIEYDVVPDPEFKMVESYGVEAAPLTVVIGRDSRIRFRHENFAMGDEIQIDSVIGNLVANTPD